MNLRSELSIEECVENLKDLRIALSGTTTLLMDKSSLFYGDFVLKSACKKYKNRIEVLEELMYNGELSNSRSGVKA